MLSGRISIRREEGVKPMRKTEMPPRPAAEGPMFSMEELRRRTAERAYDLYIQRARTDGHDLEDWLEAERLVRAELNLPARPTPVQFRNTSL